jgi:hypothetical protein
VTFLAVPADANRLLDNDQELTGTAGLEQVVMQDWTAQVVNRVALQVWFIPIIEAQTQAVLLDTASLLAGCCSSCPWRSPLVPLAFVLCI